MQKSKLNHQLDDKVNTLKEKTERMSELIEKAKKYSDPNTQDLLSKWEASNVKMKEMYEVEFHSRQQRKEDDATPKVKDIDKLIHKMQQDKQVQRKSLPRVNKHRKGEEETENKNASVEPDKNPQNNERKLAAPNSTKPPMNVGNKGRQSQVDKGEVEVDNGYVDMVTKEEEEKNNLSKPSFASKPFGKPSFAAKPSFVGNNTSDQSQDKPMARPSIASRVNNTEKYLKNDEQDPELAAVKETEPISVKRPVSFSEKYGLNSAPSNPTPYGQNTTDNKFSRPTIGGGPIGAQRTSEIFDPKPAEETKTNTFGSHPVNMNTDSAPDLGSRR
jgi:hypothetical protein